MLPFFAAEKKAKSKAGGNSSGGQGTIPFPAVHSAFDDALNKYVVRKYQPLTTVEDPDFRHMIKCANSRIKLPGVKGLKERLTTEKLKLEPILKEMTANQEEACTTDSWTSVANATYTSLSRHFIDQDWELITLPIDCIKIGGTTTARDIAATITTITERHSIKCINITTDCEPSMVAAARELAFPHAGCVDHRIEIITGILFEGKGNPILKKSLLLQYDSTGTTELDLALAKLPICTLLSAL